MIIKSSTMHPIIETLEFQFIRLKKQIQIETEMLKDLEIIFFKKENNCKLMNINDKVKESFILSNSNGIKYSESNCQSIQKSLDVTGSLVNELNKMIEGQKGKDKRKRLMEGFWSYEKQWDMVKSLYEKLPISSESLDLKLQIRQMEMKVKLNTKEITDIKLFISQFKSIKEKKLKAQIVKISDSSLKNKISSKQKVTQREKFRSVIKGNKKVKFEKSSLIGKQHNVMSSALNRKAKLSDGFLNPSHSVLCKKFKAANLYQKPSFSPTSVTTLKVPELMIPPFNPMPWRTPGNVTSTANANIPSDENGHAFNNNSDFPAKTNISAENYTSLFEKLSKSTKDGYNSEKSNSSFHLMKHVSNALQESVPRHEADTNLNTGKRGLQAVIENDKNGSSTKGPTSNADIKVKPKNVWDIFN